MSEEVTTPPVESSEPVANVAAEVAAAPAPPRKRLSIVEHQVNQMIRTSNITE